MDTSPWLGVRVPEILLPREGIDLSRWAVIACDQFTSQPEYWDSVEDIVGSAPSTLRLVLPEIYLDTPGVEERIRKIHSQMNEYLEADILTLQRGMVYLERRIQGRTRKGLMVCLDLERYDYRSGSQSQIRATEGTILERLPPRMRIRQDADLELPHILVLLDDPECTVIEPLGLAKDKLQKLYDFELMLGSGQLVGYRVADPGLEKQVFQALERLADPAFVAQKYGVQPDQDVLLFAVGDGNHSLASAKAVWEQWKPTVGMEHPARYALVEIENLHDEALQFEPIHRALFGLERDVMAAMEAYFNRDLTCTPCQSANPAQEMVTRVDHAGQGIQTLGVVSPGGFNVVQMTHSSSNLAVGTLQAFLDKFMAEGGAQKIDYVHGGDVVCQLGSQPGNTGFYLPGMDKNELFKTVLLDGALPRKTFSMGEAHEKRFYMESRKITP